ncbi:serine/threonine protein kinase [Streptomyces seoulensis]|nr:serine/threonine protein kinase [Streptomyces seoulensis]
MLVADRYRLHTVIGRGGMGEVWQAQDEVLGRPVAVKVLLNDVADASAEARFRLEAQTSARLNHPNVVGTLDFGTWDGRCFLVMELVDGGSLAAELTGGGPLRADRLAQVAQEAAEGLAAAHEKGIVHRDVKPGNLLSDRHGTIRIADFGIARFVDDPSAGLTTTGQIVGTGLYLAPERAIGTPASSASDMYSLGCVLYQLSVGHPPFEADSPTALLYQHVDAPPVPPHQRGAALPPAFETYLLGLLAKRPEDRPTARETADWFRSGAWRGAPEPLPPEEPGAGPDPHRQWDFGPGRHRGAQQPGGGPARRPNTAGHGPAPAASSASTGPSHLSSPSAQDTGWSTSVHRAASRRPAVRTSARRHFRVLAVLGGAALFVCALLLGMSMF